MKHLIGFCVQPKAPEAASPTPAAQPEAAAVPSVVRVYFPERDRAYSYYNDRFDLHEGDVVYVPEVERSSSGGMQMDMMMPAGGGGMGGAPGGGGGMGGGPGGGGMP